MIVAKTKAELSTGCATPMSAIASAVFNRLVPSHPRMTFALTVAATDLLLDALRQRDIELVISRLTDFVNDEDLGVDTLFHDELAVICSKRNKWARRRGSLRWVTSLANPGSFLARQAS